jgi:hypothetical protein
MGCYGEHAWNKIDDSKEFFLENVVLCFEMLHILETNGSI